MTLTPEREQQLIALIGRVEELERQAKTHLTSVSLDTKDIKFPGKSKYNGLDDFINNTMSSGLISGCTVTDNSNGTVAIASGYGYIRRTSDELGELIAFSIPANSSVNLTDDALNYIYVDYNSGNPTFAYTTDPSGLDHTSQFVIALAYQESDHAHIANAGQHLHNFIHNVYYHSWEVDGIQRASGLVISEDASEDRALNMTAGVAYWALQRIAIAALDTSTDGDNDTFELFYRDGGTGWTSSDVHVLPNTQYDDGDGTLANLTAQRYGVYWIYVTIDGLLYAQYGQGDYTLAQALAATVPDTMDELNSAGIFIAKVIIQASAANFYGVYLPWSSDIGSTPASDHGGLAGLADDDHTQYIKHALSTAANDFLVGSGSNTYVKKTLAEAIAILDGGADWDFGNKQLNNMGQVDFNSEVETDSETNVDWTEGNNQYVTLTDNRTMAFGTNPDGPCHLQLRVIQDAGGGNTLTLSDIDYWPGGTAPTITTDGDAIDIISIWFDGTSYWGTFLQDFQAP